jgi:hypothetical protein
MTKQAIIYYTVKVQEADFYSYSCTSVATGLVTALSVFTVQTNSNGSGENIYNSFS